MKRHHEVELAVIVLVIALIVAWSVLAIGCAEFHVLGLDPVRDYQPPQPLLNKPGKS